MTEITDEQRAAWQRIEQRMGEVENPEVDRADWALLAPLFPSELTNPQPALPTKPGIYSLPAGGQSEMGTRHTDGRELHYLNADGKWVDVGWGEPGARESRPFTRLVPERPQITREQIVALLSNEWRLNTQADAILALVNGADK